MDDSLLKLNISLHFQWLFAWFNLTDNIAFHYGNDIHDPNVRAVANNDDLAVEDD